MAKTLTKAEADKLLAAYIKEQTAAADAVIAAYDAGQDAALEATVTDIARQSSEAYGSERHALDTAAVKALIDRYAVADTLAGMGLARSGAAASGTQAIAHVQAKTAREAKARRMATLTALSEKLLTARNTAAGNKSKHASSVRQTLNGKIAEKRLSLAKTAV